jgi:hypothetical protein
MVIWSLSLGSSEPFGLGTIFNDGDGDDVFSCFSHMAGWLFLLRMARMFGPNFACMS